MILATLGLCLVLGSSAFAASPLRQQLNQRLPELQFQGVTLGDAIDFLRDVSGANIVVNWKALEGAGITRDTQVNLHLTGITMHKALDLILNEAAGGDALTYYADEGVLEITTRELADHQMVTRVYPVEDLIMDVPDFNDAPTFQLSNQNQSSGGGSQGIGQGGGSGQTTVTNQIFGNGQQNQQQQPGPTKTQRAQDLITLIENIVSPDIWKDNGGTASMSYFNGMLVVTAPRSVQEAIGGSYD